MKEIVVPLDGSRFSEHALPMARAVARLGDGRLHLVHVEEPLPLVPGRIEEPGMLEWADAYMEEVCQRLRAAGQDRVEARVLSGRVGEALVDRARDVDADLIVMSTHGRGPLNRMWIGSAADTVVRRAGCPVLLVRPGARSSAELEPGPSFERILVALDGSETAARGLEVAVTLGAATDGVLRLVQVIEVMSIPFVPEGAVDPTASKEEVRAAAAALEKTASELRVTGLAVEVVARADEEAAQGILEEAETWKADLVVLGTRGRGGAARLLLGSVADKVIRAAEGPVLVVPPRA